MIGESSKDLHPVALKYGAGKGSFAMNRREQTGKGVIIGSNPAGTSRSHRTGSALSKTSGREAVVGRIRLRRATTQRSMDAVVRRLRLASRTNRSGKGTA